MMELGLVQPENQIPLQAVRATKLAGTGICEEIHETENRDITGFDFNLVPDLAGVLLAAAFRNLPEAPSSGIPSRVRGMDRGRPTENRVENLHGFFSRTIAIRRGAGRRSPEAIIPAVPRRRPQQGMEDCLRGFSVHRPTLPKKAPFKARYDRKSRQIRAGVSAHIPGGPSVVLPEYMSARLRQKGVNGQHSPGNGPLFH